MSSESMGILTRWRDRSEITAAFLPVCQVSNNPPTRCSLLSPVDNPQSELHLARRRRCRAQRKIPMHNVVYSFLYNSERSSNWVLPRLMERRWISIQNKQDSEDNLNDSVFAKRAFTHGGIHMKVIWWWIQAISALFRNSWGINP